MRSELIFYYQWRERPTYDESNCLENCIQSFIRPIFPASPSGLVATGLQKLYIDLEHINVSILDILETFKEWQNIQSVASCSRS